MDTFRSPEEEEAEGEPEPEAESEPEPEGGEDWKELMKIYLWLNKYLTISIFHFALSGYQFNTII